MSSDLISVIDETGHERFLGNLMPTASAPTDNCPVYGDSPNTPMIPRSRWIEFCSPSNEENMFLPPVHDQDGIGMCNASAACAALEFCRAMQGLPYVALSGGDLYGRINGGSDRGSLLVDGMRELEINGVAPVSEVAYLDWRRGGNPASRLRFRVLERFLCPTYEHCMSAAISRFGLISGIPWYGNYRPDADGWLPRPSGRWGGHAMFGYAPAWRRNEFGIWHQQSWNLPWGRNGRCVIPEWAYEGPVGGWYAIRVVVDEGGVVPVLNA